MSQNQEKNSVQSLILQLRNRQHRVDCSGLFGADKAYLISRLHRELEKPVFVILSSAKDGEMFLEDLHYFSGQSAGSILYFPPYHRVSFKIYSSHHETAAKRIHTLYRLLTDQIPSLVVTTVDALLQKIIPKQELLNYAELILAGEELNRDGLVEKLISGGYSQSAIVEEPGDFSVRGGIIDIFSPLYPDPLRIELLGDRVESLRFFSAATQRKMKMIDEAILLPIKEVILKNESTNEFINQLRSRASALDFAPAKLKNLIERVQEDRTFPGIENLISLIYPQPDTLFNYAPVNALFVLIEPADLEKAAKTYDEQQLLNYRLACNEGRLCVEPDSLYMKWADAETILMQTNPVILKTLPMSENSGNIISYHFPVEDNSAIRMEMKYHRDKESLLLPLVNWINNKKQAGFLTLLVCSTRSQAERLDSLLKPYGIQSGLIEGFPETKQSIGLIYISQGQISSGFVWQHPVEGGVAIITEDEIFGAKYHRKKTPIQKIRTDLLSFADLKKGDMVVHSEHGIGQYEGLVKLEIDRIRNDFLIILYKDDDKLYVPVDRMGMVQKYLGVEGYTPVLDKMGGKSWEQVKTKVKKSVEKIAGSLLKLYAERKVIEGYSFQRPDNYFRDFEAGFPYEETPDQMKVIEEVIEDMAQPSPMDRLICGDVGYGKTEVALRASFLAINNGKQVAILVPTTVLAEQHYATFSTRFERYPAQIACLTRFRSSKEQREIVNGLKNGKIDIVIGTHRLIQKDVEFKDLGLLIVDEEHRFGVKDKEKLKKLKTTVDVLSLTATPIPRTLHISLVGVRDISLISTPPEDRHPIMTYICEFDDTLIADAIRKELTRQGQIFFVHNNIYTIEAIANHLKQVVSEVRLDIAHGRMDADDLEKVMLRFVNKEIDMLVCTTIIESGLDIPAANTIFVNRADKFGMAQLYQLRGRVGRAHEQAYAYLFVPPDSNLNKDAQKRLKVLMEHSDLGSGFQIAMNDLKIRGGGNILGASQSGHIAAVGYDMFLELMEKSMCDLKGEPMQEQLNPEINIAMSAFLSESYIPDIDQRLSAYRRLSRMTELKEIADFKVELTDRFGTLPLEAANLLLKMMVKVLSAKAGVKKIDLSGQQLLLHFSKPHLKNPSKLVQMVVTPSTVPHAAGAKGFPVRGGSKAGALGHGRFELTPDGILKAALSKGSDSSLLVQMKNILKEIVQVQSE